MNSDDLELTQLMELLDTAMQSDNPAVKIALQKLLLVSSIVHPTPTNGPLSKLYQEMDMLKNTIELLSNQIALVQSQVNGYGGTVFNTPAIGWPTHKYGNISSAPYTYTSGGIA